MKIDSEFCYLRFIFYFFFGAFAFFRAVRLLPLPFPLWQPLAGKAFHGVFFNCFRTVSVAGVRIMRAARPAPGSFAASRSFQLSVVAVAITVAVGLAVGVGVAAAADVLNVRQSFCSKRLSIMGHLCWLTCHKLVAIKV